MWFSSAAVLAIVSALTAGAAALDREAPAPLPSFGLKQTSRDEILRRNLRPPKPRRSATPGPQLYQLQVVGTNSYLQASGGCKTDPTSATYCFVNVVSGSSNADAFYVDSSGRLVDTTTSTSFAVSQNNGYYYVLAMTETAHSYYNVPYLSCSITANLLTCGFPGDSTPKYFSTNSQTGNSLDIGNANCNGYQGCNQFAIQAIPI